MNRIILGVFLGISLVLCFSTISNAQEVWTHVASACTIDEADLTEYAASGPYIYFKTSITGSIYFRCNVTNPTDGGVSPYWNTMYVTYKDPDGTGSNTQVVVRLKSVTRATGATSTIVTFNSNSYAGTVVQVQSTGLSTTWDFHSKYYFLEGYLYRATGSTADVRVYGFALEYLIPLSGIDQEPEEPVIPEEEINE